MDRLDTVFNEKYANFLESRGEDICRNLMNRANTNKNIPKFKVNIVKALKFCIFQTSKKWIANKHTSIFYYKRNKDFYMACFPNLL